MVQRLFTCFERALAETNRYTYTVRLMKVFLVKPSLLYSNDIHKQMRCIKPKMCLLYFIVHLFILTLVNEKELLFYCIL